jgi:hypothetical protein
MSVTLPKCHTLAMTCLLEDFQKSSIFYKSHTSDWLIKHLNTKIIIMKYYLYLLNLYMSTTKTINN